MTTPNPLALIELAMTRISQSQYPDADRERAEGYIAAMRDLGHITDAKWMALETRAYIACQDRRAELRAARNGEIVRGAV